MTERERQILRQVARALEAASPHADKVALVLSMEAAKLLLAFIHAAQFGAEHHEDARLN